MAKPKGRIESTTYNLICIIMMISGLLIAIHGLNRPIYNDENCTWDRVRENPVATFTHNYGNEWLALPLYPAILSILSEFAGRSEIIFRLPSLLGGISGVIASYYLASRIAGHKAGMAAAALLSITPFYVEYSTYARPYVLGAAAFTMLIVFLTINFSPSPDRNQKFRFILSALLSTALLWSHYSHFSIFFVLIFIYLLMKLSGYKTRNLFNIFLISIFVILPLVMPAVRCFTHLKSEWLPYPQPGLKSTVTNIAGAFLAESGQFYIDALLVTALTIAIFSVLKKSYFRDRKNLICLSALLIPALLSSVIPLIFEMLWETNFHHGRFLALSSPGIACCVGLCIAWFVSEKYQWTLMMALGLFLIPYAFMGVHVTEDNWRSRAAFLKQLGSEFSNHENVETPVLFMYHQASLYWDFYAQENQEKIVLVPFRGEYITEKESEKIISRGEKILESLKQRSFIAVIDYNSALPEKYDWRNDVHGKIRKALQKKIRISWPIQRIYRPDGNSMEKLYINFNENVPLSDLMNYDKKYKGVIYRPPGKSEFSIEIILKKISMIGAIILIFSVLLIFFRQGVKLLFFGDGFLK